MYSSVFNVGAVFPYLSSGIVFSCSEQSKEHGPEVGAARKNWLQSIIFIILNVTRLVTPSVSWGCATIRRIYALHKVLLVLTETKLARNMFK